MESGNCHHLNRNMRLYLCVCVCVSELLLCCAYQNPLVAFVEIINNDTKKKLANCNLQQAADDAEFPLNIFLSGVCFSALSFTRLGHISAPTK